MSTHLSHKLPWHLLVDYATPYKDRGISLPVGTCGKIHITRKRVEIQVRNRNYIEEHDICRDPTCITAPEEKRIYKSLKKGKLYTRIKGGGRCDVEKLNKFVSYFEKAVMEFAQTELNTPAKDIQYEDDVDDTMLTSCVRCDRFITLLEFGDKKELFKYSDEEIWNRFHCSHGGQAVGRNLPFLLHHVITFYLAMNIILHVGLKQEDWPRGMKPNSNFRFDISHSCDGQTFLPHSRKYLSEAMIDLEKTKILNKNLFRFIYFYAMMNLKIDKNYSFVGDAWMYPWYVWRVA